MVTNNVTIIDYGVGNLLSVRRALEHCGANVSLSSNLADIATAERLVLPGVGAFGQAMHKLETNTLIESIHAFTATERPLLGICLGMQLLLDSSTEFGHHQGLGLIGGKVLPIPPYIPPSDTCAIETTNHRGAALKVPNVGWCELHLSAPHRCWDKTLLKKTHEQTSTYFVHSYHAKVDNPIHEIARINYGNTSLAAVINRGNITGCQFHPEKSGAVGLQILAQFIAT